MQGFQPGEMAMLVDRQGRRYLVTLTPGQVFHFHGGRVFHDDILGRPEGVRVRSARGAVLRAFRPRLMDYALEMPRATAIMYPKDIAFVLVWADLFPGARVLEAGFGSAALTLFLLRAVGEGGHVTVYEQRSDLVPGAMENVRRWYGASPPNLSVKIRDVYDGVEERDLDRLLLDVPEPWRVVQHAATALRPGGIFMAYTPTITQAQTTVETLRVAGFAEIETLEVLYRPWHIKGLSVRPVQQMVAHTGFLTFARRVEPSWAGEEEADETEAEGGQRDV
ncbi:MAG TPA: tRNA (adenine-N1)-methyltransferase [Chloroflexota bacterium]